MAKKNLYNFYFNERKKLNKHWNQAKKDFADKKVGSEEIAICMEKFKRIDSEIVSSNDLSEQEKDDIFSLSEKKT